MLTRALVERKQAAFKDWSHIEEMFGIFRDRSVRRHLNTEFIPILTIPQTLQR